MLALRTEEVRSPFRVAADRWVDLLVRSLQWPSPEAHHLEVMQEFPVAELHLRQTPQYQPPLPEAQRQLVLPEYRDEAFEFPAHLRPHQLELWNWLRQSWPRVLLLEREPRKATARLEPEP